MNVRRNCSNNANAPIKGHSFASQMWDAKTIPAYCFIIKVLVHMYRNTDDRTAANDNAPNEDLRVSGFRLLGFGVVKMSRVPLSGTCTMRDTTVLRDFHELFFDYQIRVRICVSFITELHPFAVCALAFVKAH